MLACERDDISYLLDEVAPDGKRSLAMMKVYLDRGAKQVKGESGEIVTVGLVIFKPVAYKQFVRPWNRMLKAWNASAFHATDFYTGYDEFKRDTPSRQALFDTDSKRIPGLIAPHITRALAIAFRADEVATLLSEEWKVELGRNFHLTAVQLGLLSVGWWAKEIGYSGGFAYFAEGGDDASGEIEKTVNLMAKDVVTAPHVQVRSFTTVFEKGCVRGIEAADFLAWHWNHHHVHRTLQGREMEPRKDFYAFASQAGDRLAEMFLTGERLKYLLQLGDNYFRRSKG